MRRTLAATALLFVLATGAATRAAAEPASPTPPSTVPGNPCGPAAGPQCGAVPQDNGPTTVGGAVSGAANAVGGAVSGAANAVGGAVGGAVGAATGAVAGQVAGQVSDSIFDSIAKGMISWATGILKDVTSYVQHGRNQPNLGTKPFDVLYGKMEVLGALAGFVAFMVYVAGPRTHQAKLLAVARLAGAAALAPNIPRLVDVAQQVMTTLTGYISSGLGGDLSTITTAMQKATAGMGSFSSGLGFLIAILAFVAAGLILFDLILLGVVVPVIVAVSPILLGLAVHEAMIPTLKRAGSMLATALAGGFLIATFGSIGAAILVGTTGDDLTLLIEGAVILLLTAVAPFAIARLVGVQPSLHRREVTGRVKSAVGAGRTAVGAL